MTPTPHPMRLDTDTARCTIATLVMFVVAGIILSLPPHVSHPTSSPAAGPVQDLVPPIDRPAPTRHADGLAGP